MKNKKARIFADPIWVIISVIAVIVVGMFVQKSYDIFSISGTEAMQRNMPSSINRGSTFTITYVASSTSGNWGASIEDSVTGGCLFTSTDTASVKLVSLSTDSGIKSVSVRAPNYDTVCTFNGNYLFGNKQIKNFPVSTINVISSSTCASGEKQCLSSTTYKQCLASGSWSGTLSCSSGQTCTNGACSSGTTTECNTIADTDCDNIVSRDELGISISDWIEGQISRDKLGEIIMAWVNQ